MDFSKYKLYEELFGTSMIMRTNGKLKNIRHKFLPLVQTFPKYKWKEMSRTLSFCK